MGTIVFTETIIESEEQKLVFSIPLTVYIHRDDGKIRLESSVGISSVGSDFEAAWRDLRGQIFKSWNDPVLRQKFFSPDMGAREEPVKRATHYRWAANM